MDTALNMSNDLTDVLNAADNAFGEVMLQKKKCIRLGGRYTLNCISAAYDKYLFRKFSWVKNMIYPWSNYDWDYAQYTDNLYDPARGVHDIDGETITISGTGDITELTNTVEVIIKILLSLTSDANPNKNSSSSIKFKNNKYSDLPDCINVDVRDKLNNLSKRVKALHKMIKAVKQIVDNKVKKYNKDLKNWRIQKKKLEGFTNKNIENFNLFNKLGDGLKKAGDDIGSGINKLSRAIGLGNILKPPPKPKYPYGISDKNLKIWKKTLSEVKLQIGILSPKIYDKSCKRYSEIKTSQKGQKPPYKDFFFERPLDGVYSSSYFAQIGFCYSNKEKNYKDCSNKNFLWIPNPLGGACFKQRYAFIDNSPGLKVGEIKTMNGLVPSLMTNAMQLSPFNIFDVASGYSVPGFTMQYCSDKIESFKGNLGKINSKIILIILLMIFFIIYKFK